MDRKGQKRRQLERYVARLNGRIQSLDKQLAILSQTRFMLFVAAFLFSSFLFFWQGALVWGTAVIPLFIPFVVTVYFYDRLSQARNRWVHWRRIKDQHLARMGLVWELLPDEVAIPVSKNHPFGLDLDLVGERSFHQLIDTAVTHEGSSMLQQWLLNSLNTIPAINERQAVVKELVPMRLFRDKLTLYGQLLTKDGERFPGSRLMTWLGKHQSDEPLGRWLVGLSVLAGVTAVLFILNLTMAFPPVWPISLLIYGGLFLFVSNRYTQLLFQDATFIADQLEVMDQVFQYIESFPMNQTPQLRSLCSPFIESDAKPSRTIKSFRRVMVGIGFRQNPLIGLLLNLIVPWDILFAFLLRRQRLNLQERLPIWLNVWYQLEALGGLANYAALNPGLVIFPTLTSGATPCFEAKNLGHPLIQDEQRIGNDFIFEDLGDVALITGSNMAGKSSFLRTVGLNLAVAYAGGPVMADQLSSVLFRIFSSIRVTDSLQDGFSFFYAEVVRLKQILEAAEIDAQRPLLFLIDEIFRGTNNRERLIGSRSLIQALAGKTAVGLVATHDLELVKLADNTPHIKNYHFRDDVRGGKMVFDYTLRPGPSPTTNALKIMRLAGLPVDP